MTSTRDALIDAGVRLIAQRGFNATTVGEIEAAAGFVARGGTLYKHFRSKSDLLEQAMRRHVDSLETMEGMVEFLPLPDLRSELHVIGRWILARLTREEQISRVLEKEGGRFPELVAAMREGISEPGYALLAQYLTDKGLRPHQDALASAVILLGALINLRRSTWTFGRAPAGVTDERLLAAWVEMCLATLDDE